MKSQKNAAECIFYCEVVPPALRRRFPRFISFLSFVLFGAFLLGVIANLLAWFAHASLNSVSIEATLTIPHAQASSSPVILESSFKHVFGYFGQLNHGLFYMFAAPAFIGFAFSFFHFVGLTIKDMLASGTLREANQGYLINKIHNSIAFSRSVLLLLIVTGIGVNVLIEVHNRWGLVDLQNLKSKDQRWKAIGYVQTDYLGKWEKWFNQSDKGKEMTPSERSARAQELDGLVFADVLNANLSKQIAIANSLDKLALGEWIRQGVITIDPGKGPVLAGKALRWLTEKGALTLEAHRKGGFNQYGALENTIHWVFLIFAFLLEGAFQGFVGWVLFKIGYFIVMLLNFIPDRGDPHLSITPYIYDHESRFGLDLLFQCYNRIAVLIALGSFFLVIVGMDGIESQNRHHGFNLSFLNIHYGSRNNRAGLPCYLAGDGSHATGS